LSGYLLSIRIPTGVFVACDLLENLQFIKNLHFFIREPAVCQENLHDKIFLYYFIMKPTIQFKGFTSSLFITTR